MGNIKVLHVIDRLEVGGAERVFLDLTKLLLEENLEIDTLLISEKGPLFEHIDSRAKKVFLNRKNKYNLLKMLECASICANYDLIHVHMRHTYAYVKLSQIVSFKKFKIIFHDHFGDTTVPKGLRSVFKPRYYIGVSEAQINWATSCLKVSEKKCFLLKNTVIPEKSETSNSGERGEWVVVSNIRPIKNVDLAIRLANKMGKKLTIYGNAFDDSYSKSLLESIEHLPDVNIVQNKTNVQPLLNNYKLALHTSFSETGPLVLMEYLAQGVPFLAHYTGEVANTLNKDLPECFVHSLKIHDWVKAIENLESNPPDHEKLKTLFHKNFGPVNYVNQCLKIYENVLNS